MKKLIPLLSLLLSLILCLGSCIADPNKQAKEEEKLKKIWYSETELIVLDLRDLSNVTYYQLKNVFYEYMSKETATAVYEDSKLTLTFEDGKTKEWTFDAEAETLKNAGNENAKSYTVRTDLPVEYVSLQFPDYTKMDCASIVIIEAVKGLPAMADKNIPDAAAQFAQIWGSGLNNQPLITDRTTAQMNDYVNIDYKGFVNGVAFEGGEAENVDLLISSDSGYIPGFAEGIAGHEVGSTFDVEVTFPENYGSENLAGKKAVFTMTLHAIYDLRAAFYWEQVIDSVIAEQIPEESYAFFLQYYRDYYQLYAMYYGMSYHDFLKTYVGIEDKDLVEMAKLNAINYLTIYALVEQYDIEVSEEKLNAEIDKLVADRLEDSGMSEDELRAEILKTESANIHAIVAQDAVVRWLLEQNTVAE